MKVAAGFVTTSSARALADVDWQSLGLMLALSGAVLSCAATIVHRPRILPAELVLGRAPSRTALRVHVFERVLALVGHASLIGGFALQLFARAGATPGSTAFPWKGAVVVAAVTAVLLAAGWWWSVLSLRSTLRNYLRAHPRDLASETELARDIGELVGVVSHKDDTIESYVARLRLALGLPHVERARARPAPVEHPEEVEVD